MQDNFLCFGFESKLISSRFQMPINCYTFALHQ